MNHVILLTEAEYDFVMKAVEEFRENHPDQDLVYEPWQEGLYTHLWGKLVPDNESTHLIIPATRCDA